MRILYVGALWAGSTSAMRLTTLQELGHHLESVASTPAPNTRPTFFSRLANRLGHPRDVLHVNTKVSMIAQCFRPDIIWLDKVLELKPSTLEALKGLSPRPTLLSYSLDDMNQRFNQSWCYRRSIRLYDMHVTNKSYNVVELKNLGARKILFVDNAYCPLVHRPLSLTLETRRKLGGSVGFIGTYEHARAEMILALARSGIAVRVFGNGWSLLRGRDPHLEIDDACLWGDSYAEAINSFDINLCFLRKCNRDRQTTRSVEIPACGGFMLAERTDEHMRLFCEGVEAEFFEGAQELISKVNYYLANPIERQRIAAAGRQRVLSSRYDYAAQLNKILEFASKIAQPN